jgi:hypothetical protein
MFNLRNASNLTMAMRLTQTLIIILSENISGK